jgi:hypothetical protein
MSSLTKMGVDYIASETDDERIKAIDDMLLKA